MSEPWGEFWTAGVDSLALEMFERSHEPSFTDDARGMGEAREWAQRVVDEVRAAARREGQAEAWDEGVRAAQREAKRERACERPRPLINPYETEEDRHVDQ